MLYSRAISSLIRSYRHHFLGWFLCLVLISGCSSIAPTSKLKGEAKAHLSPYLIRRMAALNMDKYAPVVLRMFKEESKAEVWKQTRSGAYALLVTYDICKWSGKLGPKYVEGDRQAPEGFYSITRAQMNPYSSHYLSFNIGFPNDYDRAKGRSGSFLMVHGGCSSAGCYSMTDENIAQIYALMRDAFKGGQTAIQFQAYPFRLTHANMYRYRYDTNFSFWMMLKKGYDAFEATHQPLRVSLCQGYYAFNLTSMDHCDLYGYTQAQQNFDQQIGSKLLVSYQPHSPLSPTIKGLQEARLVAEWSRLRSLGMAVSEHPPSL